jgi:hypothetical protein
VIFFALGYFANNLVKVNKEQSLTEKISQLEEQITLLEEVINNTSDNNEKECPSCENDFPKIVFVPSGLFDEEEKEKIIQYLIEPYYAFHKDQGINYVSIMVTKNPEEIADYRYDIQAISQNETYAGFLYGEDTIEDWWIPSCMGGCEFSEQFQREFSAVVEKYQDLR